MFFLSWKCTCLEKCTWEMYLRTVLEKMYLIIRICTRGTSRQQAVYQYHKRHSTCFLRGNFKTVLAYNSWILDVDIVCIFYGVFGINCPSVGAVAVAEQHNNVWKLLYFVKNRSNFLIISKNVFIAKKCFYWHFLKCQFESNFSLYFKAMI